MQYKTCPDNSIDSPSITQALDYTSISYYNILIYMLYNIS